MAEEDDMTRSTITYALAVSLLLNAGFIGAVGYQVVKHRGLPPAFTAVAQTGIADYLKLTPEQRERWQALEADFMRQYEADAKEIAARREQLIRGIFSEQPAAERIEAEREAIARLQTEQQRRVIAQLLREREILEPAQRDALADFLLRQEPKVTPVEQVHRN
jgi:Spy/CpxP family protein refolding chaperone